MSGLLAGKIAVVTGGGSGIGAASARMLAAAGASVVIADIDADAGRSVAGDITRAGGIAVAADTDVGDVRQVEAMIRTAVETFGGLDVLFNNAAALNVRNEDYDVADVDFEIWELQLRVNLTAALAASKFAIPHMIRRGGGTILHTGSAAGILGDSTRTGYAATKAALAGLSRAIAVQYGKQNIRSNVIAPGQILSPFALRTFDDEQRQLYLDAHLTPRVGVPEDIAATVVFLASDQAAFITGQVIPVDGGFTSQLPVVPGMRRLRTRSVD